MTRLALLLALLPLAAFPAAAKADLILEAHDAHAGDGLRALGGGGHYRLAGQDEPNPTLELAAGDSVVILLQNKGGTPHDLVLGAPLDARIPCCVEPSQARAVQVDVPADASGEATYACSLHPGMGGIVHIAGADPPEPVQTRSVGLGGVLVALAALAVAAALRRR